MGEKVNGFRSFGLEAEEKNVSPKQQQSFYQITGKNLLKIKIKNHRTSHLIVLNSSGNGISKSN